MEFCEFSINKNYWHIWFDVCVGAVNATIGGIKAVRNFFAL